MSRKDFIKTDYDDLDDLFDDDDLDERLENDLAGIRAKNKDSDDEDIEEESQEEETFEEEAFDEDISDEPEKIGDTKRIVVPDDEESVIKVKKPGRTKKAKKSGNNRVLANIAETVKDKISGFLSMKRENLFKFILIIALIVVVVILVIVLAATKGGSENTGTGMSSISSADSQTASDGAVQDGSTAQQSSTAQSSAQQASEQSSTSDQSGTSEQSNTSEADTTLGAADLIGVETDDCTGQAGTKTIEQEMLDTDPGTGWHGNYYGRWYALDENTIYYGGWQDIDGNTYHFDAYGHLDRGWKLIGGQSCYFNDDGVYIPDQDNSKLLAFTFDDGPSENFDGILDLCGQYDARVTFFMIGDQVSRGGEALPYVQNFRCQLGNHSYTHSNMDEKTSEECAEDFWSCNEMITQYSVGISANVLRFPYGNITDENLASVYAPSIYWDVDSLDWQLQDTQQVIDMVLSEISEGNIILMHDRYQCTLEACQYLFPYLIEQGYSLVTVNELAAAKGIELQPGVTYYNFRGFDGTYD